MKKEIKYFSSYEEMRAYKKGQVEHITPILADNEEEKVEKSEEKVEKKAEKPEKKAEVKKSTPKKTAKKAVKK